MDNIISVTVFLAVVIISTLSLLVSRKTNSVIVSRIGTFLSLLLPSLLISFKYINNLAADYQRYFGIIQKEGNISLFEKLFEKHDATGQLEIGFWAICQLFDKLFHGNFFLVFAFLGTVSILFYYFGLKKLCLTPTQMTLGYFYILLIEYPEEWSIVRQSFAASIIFFGVCTYIRTKNPISIVLFGFLASSFHTSALALTLILLVIVLLSTIINRFTSFTLALFSVAIIIIYTTFQIFLRNLGNIPLFSKYAHYNDFSQWNVTQLFKGLMIVLFVIVIFIYTFSLKKFRKFNKISNFLVICSFSAVLFMAPTTTTILIRIGSYFKIYPVILGLMSPLEEKTNGTRKLYLFITLYIICFFLFFVYLRNQSLIFPIDFIWNHLEF